MKFTRKIVLEIVFFFWYWSSKRLKYDYFENIGTGVKQKNKGRLNPIISSNTDTKNTSKPIFIIIWFEIRLKMLRTMILKIAGDLFSDYSSKFWGKIPVICPVPRASWWSWKNAASVSWLMPSIRSHKTRKFRCGVTWIKWSTKLLQSCCSKSCQLQLTTRLRPVRCSGGHNLNNCRVVVYGFKSFHLPKILERVQPQ